ncbi:MAG: hypothetical protein LQ346_002542 [Caloplaca aetnensis]|nr:MAG: hypothetical protein LQ346_002542 [Caloplaca aetnensis]
MNVSPQVVLRPAESEAENPVEALSNINLQASKYFSKDTKAHEDRFPRDCRPFIISPREYLRQHRNLSHIHTSAAIFTHFCRPSLAKKPADQHYHEPRLLLLQRLADDPEAANCWELPGGPVVNQDQSILHGLAREIWQLTNLTTSWVLRQVGGGDLLASGWGRFLFEVHCDEICELSSYHAFSDAGNFHDFVDNIPVRVSRAHQGWSWVTKNGAQLMLDGKADASFVNGNEGSRALTAFEARENQGMPVVESGSSGPQRPDPPSRRVRPDRRARQVPRARRVPRARPDGVAEPDPPDRSTYPDTPNRQGLPTPRTTPGISNAPHPLSQTGLIHEAGQNP